MSNISGQLIKNSYDYVLQSDLITGVVYRIGGSVPFNPKFTSGLTVNASFTYADGSEFPGYVLTCDALGNATWASSSATTSGIFVTGGTFNYTTGTLQLVNSNGSQVTISGLTDTYVTGGTYSGGTLFLITNSGNTVQITGFSTSISGNYLPLSGGTVTGNTIFTSGLTATTISATTYQNLPISGLTAGQNISISGLNGNFIISYTGSTGSSSNLQYFVTGSTPSGVTLNSGDRWFDTTTGDELVWIDDGNSSQWLQICCGSGGSNLQYFISASTPTGTINSGDRWFNTTTGIELVWINDGDSSQWVQPFSVPGPAGQDLGVYSTTGITSSQTITWDKTYWGISGSTNVDLSLPTTVGKDGYYLIIKDESGICGNYRIRLTPSIGLIDGNNYVDMNINYMSLTCMSRGGNWYLI
jgi:hypothetical protein